MFNNKSSLALEEKALLKVTKYAAELGAAVEDTVNPETIIYLLKNQIVDATVFNHNLKRVVSFLIWKLSIERANASIKGEMGEVLHRTINSLEELIKKYFERRQHWKQQLDKYDYELMCLKAQLESRRGEGTVTIGSKPRLKKAINKRVFIRQSTCRVLDGTGKCITRIFSPHGHGIPRKQLSGLNFSKFSEAVEAISTGQEKEEPEVVETVTREEMAKVEGELHEAKMELVCQKTLAQMLMEELSTTRNKLTTLRGEVNIIKESAEQAIKDENNSWRAITVTLKKNHDKELARKQGEITHLHNQIAEWIMKYVELERGKMGSESLKKLLQEYYFYRNQYRATNVSKGEITKTARKKCEA